MTKVVELSKQALSEGKCVVIGLQHTGEATQDAVVEGAEVSQSIEWVSHVSEKRGLMVWYVCTYVCMYVSPYTQESNGGDDEDDIALSTPKKGLERILQRFFPTPMKPKSVLEKEAEELRLQKVEVREVGR